MRGRLVAVGPAVIVWVGLLAGCGSDGEVEVGTETSTSSTDLTSSTTVPSPTVPSPTVPVPEPPPTTDAGPDPTTTTTTGPNDPGGLLIDRTFSGDSVTESGVPRPLLDGTEIQVTFERRTSEDIVGWNVGCNSFGTAVVITQDRLELDDEVAGTAIGCADDTQAQDEWFISFMRADPAWSLDGDTFTLTSGDTVVTLTGQ